MGKHKKQQAPFWSIGLRTVRCSPVRKHVCVSVYVCNVVVQGM